MLAAHLSTRHPGVEVVVDNAARLPELLRERGVSAADVVVSGLPWASFSHDHQSSVLQSIMDALSPDGAFTTFSYVHARMLPPAMRFRRRLAEAFEEVVIGRTVWRNLPPAFVYHSRRARVLTGGRPR
jgi:phospholipid N-methyltransferase